MEKAVKEYSKEFLIQVVEATPKLSGAAKNNWEVGINDVPSQFVGPLYPGVPNAVQVKSVQRGVARISNYRLGSTIYIVNNLPYINRLNAGYSRQAPAGFIENARSRALNSLYRRKFLE
jgi:hypothetical protein